MERVARNEQRWRPLRYRPGDRVRIVSGMERDRHGEIVAVYPTHDRPYLVKLNDAWYVHYPEDRLAPAY